MRRLYCSLENLVSRSYHEMTEDESKIRVEEPTNDEEKRGLLRPLPGSQPAATSRGVPIVKFLGITMTENKRDYLVAILTPFLVAVVDTALYALVVIDALPEDALYMFALPVLMSITVGLVVPQTSKAVLSAFLTGVFFLALFVLFLVAPGFAVPEVGIGDFFFAGMVLGSIYFLFVVFASFVGTLVGVVLREFL
jgi:hypothetical protein